MKQLSQLLKSKRESKGLLLREVASEIEVDTALVSKIENSDRRPTKEQLKKLSKTLEIDFTKLLTMWYVEKIYEEIGDENNVQEIVRELNRVVRKKVSQTKK
ncbi:MAG: helix-turn-helix domain-containing protein [Psychroflexus halocasei]|uniref:helix-turn-helix domain-containing protein n=1 Tax=Psychroflexus sp. S27 TaxID=1982757 RepID=UPI000C29FC0A|nr:helix-turn-helix transcriptional regulator [Psychroflexus sp. S27]PJX21951.1 transcriptional regulator [Psychroflexus sp. S27]